MDIRKIEYFICVVEEASFTKAAKRVCVSQSGISQQIASLEEEIGATLINRSKNKFAVTEAGVYLYKACKEFIEQYHSIERKTRAIHCHSQLDINMGYAGPLEFTVIEPVVSLIQESYPDLNFTFDKSNFREIRDALLNRSMDMVIAYSYDLIQSKQIETIPLKRDAMGLIVSKKHPLAGQKKIRAVDVANEKLIMLDPDYGQKNYENMIKCCRMDGYEANIIQEVKTCENLILKVAANTGVAFFSRGYAEKMFQNICFVELEGTHHINRIDLAWLKDNSNDYILQIIRLIQKNAHKLF